MAKNISRLLACFTFAFGLASALSAQIVIPYAAVVGSSTSRDTQGNLLTGFANTSRGFATDGKNVVVINRTGANDSTVQCSKDWGIYTVPITGGAITPLVTSSTPVEPNEPAGTSALICNGERLAGNNVIFGADYIPTGGQERFGFFKIPFAGGASSDVLANGDSLASGGTSTVPRSGNSASPALIPQIYASPSLLLKDYAVDTSTTNGTYRQLTTFASGSPVTTSFPVSPATNACPGFVLGNTSASAIASGPDESLNVALVSNYVTGNIQTSHTAIVTGSNMTNFTCDHVVYDPYDYVNQVYKALPGEPAQPTGYVLTAPILTPPLIAGGKIYFGASRIENNHGYYSGVFVIDSNGAVTNLLSATSIPGYTTSPAACTNGFTTYPLLDSYIVGNSKYVVFLVSQGTYDCTQASFSFSNRQIFAYNFSTGISKQVYDLSALPTPSTLSSWAFLNGMLSPDSRLLYGVITAQDSNSNPTATTLYAFNIDQVPSATNLSAPSTSTYGQSVTLTAKVSADSTDAGAITGFVDFSADGTTLGRVALDNTGQASVTTNTLSAGTHQLLAAYESNFVYTGSQSAASTLTVATAATATSLSPVTASHYPQGSTIPLQATVSASNGTPTGTVTFYDNGATISSATLPASSVSYSAGAAGLHNIQAVYSGDGNYSGSSVTNTYYVTVPTLLSASLTPESPQYGNSVSAAFAASQGSNATAPTGSISYALGSGTASSAAVGSTVSLGKLPAGSYTLTLSYSGDNVYSPSTKVVNFSVAQASLIAKAADASRQYGAANPTFSGNLSGVVPGDGITATFSSVATSTSPVGSYPILATLSDPSSKLANYIVTAAQGTLTVTQASDILTFAPASNTAPMGSTVPLTATLKSSTSGVPTGAVSFYANGNLLGTGTINASGVATYAYAASTVGTFTLSASYGGDANFTAAASAGSTLAVGVPDFAISANPTALSIPAGSSGTITFTVTPSFGYNQTISLACNGLPANTTCTFAPSALTPNGAPVSSVLTVQTNVKAAALDWPRFFGNRGAGYTLALLGLPALYLLRRRKFTQATLLLLLTLNFCALSGCSGGNSNTPATPVYVTPQGTNTVSVTASASAGTGSGQHAVSVTITVQ